MTTKEILKKVRKIEIKTKRLSDNIFGGEYHSSFKGRGMTFSEVRPYAFGDDVRNIDWNVTARYRTPFVKVFEEERELTMLLAVDISGSEWFGSKNQLKREMITEIVATLAFSATQNNDKVGLVLYSDEIELFIPPQKGRSHVLRIIREMIDFNPKHLKTDTSKALKFVYNVLKKKAIVFMISDFIDKNYEDTLKIVGKKHDLTGIMVYDPMEKEMPDLGLLPVKDLETGKTAYIDTGNSQIRRTHNAAFLQRQDYFKKSFQKAGAGVIWVATNGSYIKKMLQYFKARA
jgi:uncharacterized protein (DUF58 family)